MGKNINEKTFELNITNELLNLSKSFIWYLDHSPLCWLLPRTTWSQFLNQSTLFAAGLTQDEESDPLTGGYDVSINYTLPNGQDGRLIFLQYKAGVRKAYSNANASKFNRKIALKEKRPAEHVSFTFNDAAQGTQHSTLRNLANKTDIQSHSVMYVFPRITEKADFESKIGSLIFYSSFVPVLELDNQASNQTPQVSIIDGVSHNYRTSYDGLTSEVNYFFYYFYYDPGFISLFVSELICIQIERFAKSLRKEEPPFFEIFINGISDAVSRFIDAELKAVPSSTLIQSGVSSYIGRVREGLAVNKEIPAAPSVFTTIIPKEGLKLKFDNKNDLSLINYQLF